MLKVVYIDAARVDGPPFRFPTSHDTCCLCRLLPLDDLGYKTQTREVSFSPLSHLVTVKSSLEDSFERSLSRMRQMGARGLETLNEGDLGRDGRGPEPKPRLS